MESLLNKPKRRIILCAFAVHCFHLLTKKTFIISHLHCDFETLYWNDNSVILKILIIHYPLYPKYFAKTPSRASIIHTLLCIQLTLPPSKDNNIPATSTPPSTPYMDCHVWGD